MLPDRSNITALGELPDDNTALKASANTAQYDEPHSACGSSEKEKQ